MYFVSPTSALKSALVFFTALSLVACNSKTMELFFDIPPPKPKTEIPEEIETPVKQDIGFPGCGTGSIPGDSGLEPLPIEDLTTWEEVLEMLPKDYKKKADWSAAVKQGIVRPRTGTDPKTQLASAFKYDFIIAAEKPKNEAYFPHSAHTEWLGCKNCHMTLYPYKRNPASMKEMRAGASCGACHGKVAFSLKQCKRCHLQR